MKSSLGKYKHLSLGNDPIINELIQECKSCVEGTRLTKTLRDKLERYGVPIYVFIN